MLKDSDVLKAKLHSMGRQVLREVLEPIAVLAPCIYDGGPSTAEDGITANLARQALCKDYLSLHHDCVAVYIGELKRVEIYRIMSATESHPASASCSSLSR